MTTSFSSQRPDFWLGCNYWASHAGTAMWRDWRPDIVARDLDALVGVGVETLRVFPLWPDFQPIHCLRGYQGKPNEFRFGEEPLPEDELGRAGISAAMLGRFEDFADMTQARGMRLIPALITGWMSARVFAPPALEGLNLICDPVAILWQVRFVRGFVRHFRSRPDILAWGLGNECNCLGQAHTRADAWRWTAQIADAIRAEDATRPVLSDMHSLDADRNALWTIEDQAESTDRLTVHPYPLFTPHCQRDPLNTLRSGLHATAESVLYADVGGKRCLAEEVGTLGQTISSEEVAADYLRAILFSLWSHGDQGLLWWCGFEQDHLEHAPYDWKAVERNLGLLHADHRPKPVAGEIKRFAEFLAQAPALAERRREAVCILTEGQDNWGAAFGTFLLAKQAGIDVRFQTAFQPLADSELYLLPSISTQPRRGFWLRLLEKVRAGATLYLSANDPMLSNTGDWMGFTVTTRQQRQVAAELRHGDATIRVDSSYRLNLDPCEAEVLAAEPDGNPAYLRWACGRGEIYMLTVPLETYLIQQPGVFAEAEAGPHVGIYERFTGKFRRARAIQARHPQVGVTEHATDSDSCHAVLINYGPVPVAFPCQLGKGWRIVGVVRGTLDGETLTLPAGDAAVLELVHAA